MLGLNVRCLSYHLDEFKVLLASLDQKPDVIALTETWMTVDDDMSDYKLEGYQPIEANARKVAKRRSGGVAFYIRTVFHYTPVEVFSDIECSIIKVNYTDKDSKLFCVIYRPDTYKLTQFLQQFENLPLFLKSLKYESFLFGDFNIDTLIDETNKNRYENILKAYDLAVQNSEPTRVTPTSKTCLGHFISSSPTDTITLKTTISDHYKLLGKIPLKYHKTNESFRPKVIMRDLRNITNENASNFLFLLNHKLKKIPDFAPAVEQVESIIKSVRECIDKHAPEKMKPLSESTNDWIFKKTKNAITRRNTLFVKWIINLSTENQERYKTITNKVSALTREAKKEKKYRKLGKDPTAKCIYRTLKAINCNQESSPPVIDPDIMNDFFFSIGPKLSSKLPVVDPNINITRVPKTMFLQPTDQWEVAKILKQMKNKKSYGLDGISNEIGKSCSPVIEPAIAAAFTKCTEVRTFPKCLKIAKVIPLFKKGDKRNPENSRPISLLSSISNVFEKLLQSRMIKFCEKNCIISGYQYGFRSNRSCIDANVSITEFIRTEIDRKSLGQACFIDLQEAFDTLDHNILLQKLEKYEYRGPIHDMMKSYLSDRWQYVGMNAKETNQKRITTGVPRIHLRAFPIPTLYQ